MNPQGYPAGQAIPADVPPGRTRSQRPIFVVGFPRSGTTLVQTLLGAHSSVAAPPELHFISRFVHFRDHWGPLSDHDRVGRIIHELLNPKVPMLEHIGWDEDEIVDRVLGRPRTWGNLLGTVLDWYAESEGKQRWSEKTPMQLPHQILMLFPDALIVHIVRSPRAAIASMLAAGWTTADAEQLAHSWDRFTRAAMKTGERHSEAYLRIHLDDLIRDPSGIVSSICHHIGEDYEPSMMDERRERSAAIARATSPWQGGAGRAIAKPTERVLAPWDRLRVAPVVDDLAAGLGYDVASRSERLIGRLLSHVPSPSRVRHWRQQRRLQQATTPAERHELFEAHLDAVARRVDAISVSRDDE